MSNEPRRGMTYERLHREHHDLRNAMGSLGAFLQHPRPEHGEPGSHKWAQYLSSRLVQLHDRLERHFDDEETSGLLARLCRSHPERSTAIQALYGDHPVFLRDLRGLIDDLIRYSEGQPVADPRIRYRLHSVLTRLRDHEASETELVQRIVTRDEGVAD